MLVPKAGASGDASRAGTNWATITTSPKKPTSRTLAGREISEFSGERGSSRQRAAAFLRLWDLHRLRASPGRGAEEARSGLIVGLATQVVPGASIRARVSLASRQDPPPVELPKTISQPTLPRVTQEAAPRPPSIKDTPAGAAERYQEVPNLPLAGMSTGRVGRLETIEGGDEEPGADEWERHLGSEASTKEN